MDKSFLGESLSDNGSKYSTPQGNSLPGSKRIIETLTMNQICDVYDPKEGFWIEKRSDISQYFLYIDILLQFKGEADRLLMDNFNRNNPQNSRLSLSTLPHSISNFQNLLTFYPDRFYEGVYSFYKIQVDLLKCKNLYFGKYAIFIFLLIQLAKLTVYFLPIILVIYVDFYYILVYQLVVLASLAMILYILCSQIIAFASRTEAVMKMKLNDKSVPYTESYENFVFNDRLTHSLSDGLSWFFISISSKSKFMYKLGCCEQELSNDFITKITSKYEDIPDDEHILTIVYNSKWLVSNNKAYQSLNDKSFDFFIIIEIFISLIAAFTYSYYLVENFDLY